LRKLKGGLRSASEGEDERTREKYGRRSPKLNCLIADNSPSNFKIKKKIKFSES